MKAIIVAFVAILTVLAVAGCNSASKGRTWLKIDTLADGRPLDWATETEEYQIVFYESGRVRAVSQVSRIVIGEGAIRMYYEGGSPLYYIEIHDGQFGGRCLWWYPSGQLREKGQFKEGEPIGIWEQFTLNGESVGSGTLGEPAVIAGSFGISDPASPLSLNLPTIQCYRKGDDWGTAR